MSINIPRKYTSSASLRNSIHMKACVEVLTDLFIGLRCPIELSRKDLDPLDYANIAAYASDCIEKSASPKYDLLKFTDDIADRIYPNGAITAKKSASGLYCDYAIPVQRIEYYVAITFTYCYLVKKWPDYEKDLRILVDYDASEIPNGANAATDYLLFNILKPAYTIKTDVTFPTEVEHEHQLEELKQQIEQLKADCEKYRQQIKELEEINKSCTEKAQAHKPRPVGRGVFGKTEEGRSLDLKWFQGLVQKEFVQLNNVGEWAALHYFCVANNLIPSKTESGPFLNSLFAVLDLRDDKGCPIPTPDKAPVSRYSKVLKEYGIENLRSKIRGMDKKPNNVTDACLSSIERHYRNLTHQFKHQSSKSLS